MKRWTTSFLLVALACTFGLLGGGIVMYIRSALASRNSSGTYSLATSPVTTLQTISTSLWNNTFADLATGVTDSLDRNGRGGMLAALRGIDGTVAAPAFAYTSETGSGEYRIGAGDLGWAILGGKKLELTSSLFTVTPASTFTGNATFSGNATLSGVALAANGAVGAPSYSFTNDATAGLYRGGSADFRFAVTGADKTFWNATGFGIGVAPLWKLHVQLASSGATALASTSAMIESNGTHFLNLLAPNANSSGIAFGDVSNAARGYIEYKNTTNASADQMQFGAAGATKMVIGSGGLTIGATGTAIAQINSGSCATNGGTPSVCTATVASGAKCVANLVGTSASTDSVTTSVSSTTLTITVQNGVSKTANYICF